MDDDNQNGSEKPKRVAKPKKNAPTPDRPYRVGKGKPPIEYQFKKGGPSPNRKGRPKGSTRASSLEKLLNKKVVVGHKNNRPIRKPLGEVIDHKLVEAAAKGDLKAIKLIKDYEYLYRKAGFYDQPSIDEVIRQREEEEKKKRLVESLSAKYVDYLETIAELKKFGLIDFVDGRTVIQPWAIEAAKARKAEKRDGPNR